MNLLSNAIDVVEPREGLIRVVCHYDPDNKQTVIVRRLNARLLFESESRAGLECLPLARVLDLAIPLPGFMKRQAEKQIVNTALGGLKKRVESES